MACSKCGNPVHETSIFCDSCGHKLQEDKEPTIQPSTPETCSECGNPVRETTSAFCDSCGHKLQEDKPEEPRFPLLAWFFGVSPAQLKRYEEPTIQPSTPGACSECGNPVHGTSIFCDSCGHKLQEDRLEEPMIHPSTISGKKQLSKIWNLLGGAIAFVVSILILGIWEPFGDPLDYMERLSTGQFILFGLVMAVGYSIWLVLDYRKHGWN